MVDQKKENFPIFHYD